MSLAHTHLVITHLPIFGSLLGSFILMYGLWQKSSSTLIAAYGVFIIFAVGAGIAYATGEGAEKAVEHLQDISKSIIEQHEDAALTALIATIIVGVISSAGLIVTYISSPLNKPFAWITLLFAFLGFGLVARTGYLGGQIRHTEVATTISTSTTGAKKQ